MAKSAEQASRPFLASAYKIQKEKKLRRQWKPLLTLIKEKEPLWYYWVLCSMQKNSSSCRRVTCVMHFCTKRMLSFPYHLFIICAIQGCSQPCLPITSRNRIEPSTVKAPLPPKGKINGDQEGCRLGLKPAPDESW
jgi:hypothetical protein